MSLVWVKTLGVENAFDLQRIEVMKMKSRAKGSWTIQILIHEAMLFSRLN